MHTHLVAANVWRHWQGQAVEQLLRRVADEQIVLVSTGASDWLDSSGTAERVAGGYRVSGRKIFGSGSPVGDLLVTSAPYADPRDWPTVLHFPIPMRTPGLTVQDNWQAMGMRGTGSHDVLLESVFVPDSSVSLRRPRGTWHPYFTMVAAVALPIVMSVYLGVAEAARDLALQQMRSNRGDPDVSYLVREVQTALTTARIAVQGMVDLCANYAFTPDLQTANAVLIRKTIAAEALLETVEKAVEACGGGALFRRRGLERLLRDIHGAQFHPL